MLTAAGGRRAQWTFLCDYCVFYEPAKADSARGNNQQQTGYSGQIEVLAAVSSKAGEVPAGAAVRLLIITLVINRTTFCRTDGRWGTGWPSWRRVDEYVTLTKLVKFNDRSSYAVQVVLFFAFTTKLIKRVQIYCILLRPKQKTRKFVSISLKKGNFFL